MHMVMMADESDKIVAALNPDAVNVVEGSSEGTAISIRGEPYMPLVRETVEEVCQILHETPIPQVGIVPTLHWRGRQSIAARSVVCGSPDPDRFVLGVLSAIDKSNGGHP